MSQIPPVTIDDVAAVSPALAHFTREAIIGGAWRRPDLSPRDRSVVTVAALVSAERTIGFTHYFNLALASGVTAAELSEIVTHVAFYGGWSGAFSAVTVLRNIFAERGIGPEQLAPISPTLSSPAEFSAAETARNRRMDERLGETAPDLASLAKDLLYGDLWRRPGLSERDRYLATLAALIARHQTGSLPEYAEAALLAGIAKPEIAEIVTHLSFYEGFPAAFAAADALQEVLSR